MRYSGHHGDADNHGSKGTARDNSHCAADDLFRAPARLHRHHWRVHSGVQRWPRHWLAGACPLWIIYRRDFGRDASRSGHPTLCHAKPDEQFSDRNAALPMAAPRRHCDQPVAACMGVFAPCRDDYLCRHNYLMGALELPKGPRRQQYFAG